MRWPSEFKVAAVVAGYIGRDEYPFRRWGEERIEFVIQPVHARHQKQGSV